MLNGKLKEALELLKTDREAAKKEVVEAVGLLNSLEKLVEKTKTDTEVWRTDKTTMDQETANYISKQSTVFMTLMKNIKQRVETARLSLQKVHAIVGKVN